MSIQERVYKISRNNNLSIDTPKTTAKIELSGICTLRCKFCYNSKLLETGERQRLMSDKDFKKVLEYIDSIKTVKEVGLFYMGESGLHPKLATYYKILQEHGYFTYLTTNGTCFDNVSRAIPFIDSLKVSWNYKNQKDFIEKTNMPVSIYHKIKSNIKKLYDRCHDLNKEFTISTVLDSCKEDYNQELATLPYDEHYWIPLQTQGGNFNGVDGVVGESESQVSPIPCWSLFKGLYVDVDLNIRACCYGHSSKHILGNLNDIKSVHNSNIIKEEMLTGSIPVMCKECLKNER